jgi:methylmalonyl-CoA mutase
MSDLSFNEFSESTFEQWQQLVQKELGERAIDTLDWEIEEELAIGPYFTSAEKSFSIGYEPSQEQYQLISHSNPKEWNRIALDSLMGGTNALGVDCSSHTPDALPVLLAGIEVKYISIHFVNMHDGFAWANAFKKFCDDSSLDTTQLNGSFGMKDLPQNTEAMMEWKRQTREFFQRFRIVTIDVCPIHENGGSIVHELAWALTAGHEALHRLIDSGSTADEASACLQFNFATGSSYFPQIAKIRAFRWMWKRVIEAYNPAHACSVHTFVHASTSRYLQTAKDKHNNLLRATTQAMSAMIGGANSVDVLSFHAWSSQCDESALRWARNIQQLLLEESYFSQYKTVADGAFYIEELTAKLVAAAWARFQILDAKAANEGIESASDELNQLVQAHSAKQQEFIKEGKRVIVGVNRYVNKTDSAIVDESAQTLSAPFEKA